jgi:hypothetical protein
MIREQLHAAGVPVDGAAGEIAVLTLRLRSAAFPVGDTEIARIRGLLGQMRSRHWWVSLPEDLPACALLGGCRGSSHRLEAQVEKAYLALLDHGFAGGLHLHAAAALLPLVGLSGERATDRFLGVAQAFRQYGPPRPVYAPALALLCLLDHEPEAIAEQSRAIDAHLSSTLAGPLGHTGLLVTAGLAFLDLAPYQRDGTLARAPEARRRLIRDFQSALIALAPATIAPASQSVGGVLDD